MDAIHGAGYDSQRLVIRSEELYVSYFAFNSDYNHTQI